jgi:hypothetical protein
MLDKRNQSPIDTLCTISPRIRNVHEFILVIRWVSLILPPCDRSFFGPTFLGLVAFPNHYHGVRTVDLLVQAVARDLVDVG